MKKQIYTAPEIQLVEFSEQVKTLDIKASNPDVDGTSVLVSWLIG